MTMAGWREQEDAGRSMDMQDDLWKWIDDNVDFHVRSRRL